jgi:hypothetical protein
MDAAGGAVMDSLSSTFTATVAQHTRRQSVAILRLGQAAQLRHGQTALLADLVHRQYLHAFRAMMVSSNEIKPRRQRARPRRVGDMHTDTCQGLHPEVTGAK